MKNVLRPIEMKHEPLTTHIDIDRVHRRKKDYLGRWRRAWRKMKERFLTLSSRSSSLMALNDGTNERRGWRRRNFSDE
jgi:hypothetical protein